jgi:hypothetical protein
VETVSTSILREKATKRDIKKISGAPPEIQIAIFQETLVDLEKYLDTGDLRKLNGKSLGIIRDDTLKIIDGLRDLRPRLMTGTVRSLDGTLDKLRDARDNLQVALGMFDLLGRLNESKSKKFFAELRLARKNIEEALGLFKPMRSSRRMV